MRKKTGTLSWARSVIGCSSAVSCHGYGVRAGAAKQALDGHVWGPGSRDHESANGLFVAVFACWHGQGTSSSVGRRRDPSIALSFWRWLTAFLCLLPIAWPHIRVGWPTGQEWKMLALLSLVGMALFHSLLFAVHWTTAINALLIMSICPAVIPVMSRIIWGERLTGRQALGIAGRRRRSHRDPGGRRRARHSASPTATG